MAKDNSKDKEKEAALIVDFETLLRKNYYNEMVKLAEAGKPLVVDFNAMDEFSPDMGDFLINSPEKMFEVAEKAAGQIDLPGKIKIRFADLPDSVSIRDLRSRHIDKFISVEGIVRKSSEIRPEIIKTVWECPECSNIIEMERKANFIPFPNWCDCGNRKGFKQIDKKLVDTRWLFLEEPFELTEGERPSQVIVMLTGDILDPEGRRMTDPGNRLKITGVLKDIPKGKSYSIKLDFYMDANHVQPTEAGWEKMEISKEDEKEIKKLSKDPKIYEKLTASLAPTIYGLNEVKEGIILQLFGGVPRTMKDGTKIRGNIHALLIGDPACLIADERVVMADGTIMKIADMGSKHLQDINHRVHLGMGRNVGKAAKFHIYKQQPIIEIVTETGKSIQGTYNQPVLVVKNRKQSWRRLDEIKAGERVQVLPKIECRKKTFVETNWEDYPQYHKSWQIKVPKFVDENLAGLFGYIVADGWVQDRRLAFVINEDESDILPKIKNVFEKYFNAPVHKHKHKRASPKITYYQVDRTHIAKLLSFLNEKRVPNLIFRSGDSVVASFLRWLYEGDGCVFCKGRGRTSVSLKSANIELLRDVQILLLRFGIHSRILWENKTKEGGTIEGRKIIGKPSGSLMIRRSESIIKFWKNIGFVSKKKKLKLKETAEYAKTHIHRIHPKRTEKIVKINKLPPQDVFDIEVPNYQRFIANGVVVHNTAKSQILKLVPQIVPRARYVSGKGVTAAGLCVSPDSLVLKNPGSISKIEDIVEEKLEDNSFEYSEGVWQAKNPENNDKVFTIDEDLKIKPQKVKQFWKLKAPEEMIAIELQSGKTITATKNTKLLTIKKGKIIWKKSEEFKENECLATARNFEIQNQNTNPQLKIKKPKNKLFAHSDILWDKIKSIKIVKPNYEYVYDLTVNGSHNFLVNGIIVHNTASVTKDEQFMGGWVLEAGAIVLANKGLLSIDEFEKMNPDDQVAMHEALEQGCYDQSTQITLSDGGSVNIGDFVDQFTKGEKGERISKDISDKNINVISTDFKNIKKSKAVAVGKHIEDLLYKIKLKTGQELIITPKHPVFVLRNNKKEIIEAKDLTTEDYMPVFVNLLDKKSSKNKTPVEWVKIKSIKEKKGKQWVYDVEVNPTGIFIGNGIVCHNSVSIAKASIVATLPADTSVLAGGNPKFSRFDPYLPIAKQIIIPDTLLGRFDLKFALRDIPHEESDKKVTEHILKSREDDYEESKPKIDPNFIKKYVAYAKENCKPELSKEAGRMIRTFYTRTRKKAEGGSAPVPITLRQFEAMLRLSEASAKIQLQPEVRKEDAQRAIRLMKFSLKQLGFDPESGLIDVDKAEGGTTSSERSHIRIVLDIIEELSKKKKEIAVGEIKEMAGKDGVENAEEIVEKLKREGMLFEPNPGYVQKV